MGIFTSRPSSSSSSSSSVPHAPRVDRAARDRRRRSRVARSMEEPRRDVREAVGDDGWMPRVNPCGLIMDFDLIF